tara:strand:+ start:501 stop:761 length:261 start_codon:yes stop_codon:yes gene_type:complete
MLEVELEDFIIQTLDLLQVVELVVEVLLGQIVEMQLLTLAVEEVHLMPTLPQPVVLEQVVQVSWSRERLQVKELYYKQVQDVQDHL